MSGFFSKFFGGKKEDGSESTEGEVSRPRQRPVGGENLMPEPLVEETLDGVLSRSGLDLTYELRLEDAGDETKVFVELNGGDEEMLTEDNGELLDAVQLLVKRVLQHKLPDLKVEVYVDSNGYREQMQQELVELADRLKEKCLSSGKSQYVRALPPKDRKVVHQHLANDDRVRSRSVGEGLFKKIKIYPAKLAGREEEGSREESAETV